MYKCSAALSRTVVCVVEPVVVSAILIRGATEGPIVSTYSFLLAEPPCTVIAEALVNVQAPLVDLFPLKPVWSELEVI